MKRRSFLQAIGAGAITLAAPVVYSGTGWSGPTCARSLTEWMESKFYCVMGEPSAFMELQKHDANKFFTDASMKVLDPAGDHQIIRISYDTLVYAVEGYTAKEAEAMLAKNFYEGFKELDENDRKQIVWRVKPQFGSDYVREWGDTYLTSEQLEDKAYNNIKECDLEIPEGVQFDFNTNSYKYVKKSYYLHKMRMRLAMPEVNFEKISAYKLEGEQPTRI